MFPLFYASKESRDLVDSAMLSVTATYRLTKNMNIQLNLPFKIYILVAEWILVYTDPPANTPGADSSKWANTKPVICKSYKAREDLLSAHFPGFF